MPADHLTELQLETLRVNVGAESACDAAAYEAAAADGRLVSADNVGAIAGGAVGAVGLALLLLISPARAKKKPKA